MDDRELENLLHNVGREKLYPPDELISATIHRIRDSRLFTFAVGASIISQMVWVFIITGLLISPDIDLKTKIGIYGFASAVTSLVIIVILSAREKISALSVYLEKLVYT